MNDRWVGPVPEKHLSEDGNTTSCFPLVRSGAVDKTAKQDPGLPAPRKANNHGPGRKDFSLPRDALFTLWRDNSWHVVSEDYSYKTESYYSILHLEMDKRPVLPSSSSVLDAYVVPICLEQAHLAGIPVCEWGISQGYAPLPSILYGLNYFATASDYTVVRDNETVKEVVKHITNKGKYPFCYQKLDEGAEIGSCVAIFGKTAGDCPLAADMARDVYNLFSLPLVTIVYVRYGDRYLLSSLSPVKYSRLSDAQRSLLSAYLCRQEFL